MEIIGEAFQSIKPYSYYYKRIPSRYKVITLALISISANEVRILRIFGFAISHILFIYIAYILTKPILEYLFPEIAGSQGVRIVLTGVSLGSYLLIGIATSVSKFIIYFAVYFMILVPVAIVLLRAYVKRFNLSSWENPDVIFADISAKLNLVSSPKQGTEKLKEDREMFDSIWYRRLADKMVQLGIFTYLVIPFLMIGPVLAIFSGFYPALEVLLIFAGLFGPRIGQNFSTINNDESLIQFFDNEENLVKSFSNKNMMSFKGISIIGSVTANVLPIIILFIGFLPRFVTAPNGLIVSITGGTTLLIFSLYGLWYWRTLLLRAPHYLEFWKRENGIGQNTNNKGAKMALKTRPPKGMYPPTLLLLTFPVVFINFLIYLVIWSIGTLVVVLSIAQWENTLPQPAHTDERSFIINTLVQSIGIIFMILGVNLATNNSPTSFAVRISIVPPILAISSFYYNDVYLLLSR